VVVVISAVVVTSVEAASVGVGSGAGVGSGVAVGGAGVGVGSSPPQAARVKSATINRVTSNSVFFIVTSPKFVVL
jgi:hypothetical protein